MQYEARQGANRATTSSYAALVSVPAMVGQVQIEDELAALHGTLNTDTPSHSVHSRGRVTALPLGDLDLPSDAV